MKIQKLKETIHIVITTIFTLVSILTVNVVIPLVKSILQMISIFAITTHKLIMKTGAPIKVYSWLSLVLVYVLFASAINFQIYKWYNTAKFEWYLSQSIANVQAKTEERDTQKQSLESIIADSLTTQIESVITTEKNLCIEQEMLDYKQDIRSHSFIYPSDEELSKYEAEVSNGVCSVKNLKDNTYVLVLQKVFGKDAQKLIDTYKSSWSGSLTLIDSEFSKKIDEIKKKLEVKEVEDGLKQKIESVLENVNENAIAKTSNSKVKAIFCSYGHWMGVSGWNDNGATSKYQDDPKLNGITERDLIMKVMPETCKQIQEKVKDKWIIVYEIGKDRTTLKDKIKIINEISKEKGYDEHSAIWVELHYNTASTKERNGIEVIYSQLETPEYWRFGPDLANNMLYHIKKTHTHWNLYRIKSDKSSRYKSLGILSETKPTIVLVEYGFLTNSKDTAFALNKIKEQQKALVDGIVTYIK